MHTTHCLQITKIPGVRGLYKADETSMMSTYHILANKELYEIQVLPHDTSHKSGKITLASRPLHYQRVNNSRHIYTGSNDKISWDTLVSRLADNFVDII